MEVMTVGEYVSGEDKYSSWNGDHSYSISADYPWSLLGGRADNGSVAGLWAVHMQYGNGWYNYGFRAVQSGVLGSN